MKILLTGAAGFVGSNVLSYFNEEGYDITGCDNLSFGYKENVPDGCNMIYKSFEKLSGNYLNEHDVLIHCACANIIYSQEHPIETFRVNAKNTIELFEKFRGKIIYTSTASVYGQAYEIPTKEDSEIFTYNAYDQSKYIAELYLKLRGNYTTLRLSNVYGKNQRPENTYSGVIGKFIDSALNKEEMKVYGDGIDTRDFTYITDVVSAIDKAVSIPAVNCAVNIATCRETSILKLATTITDYIGEKLRVKFIAKRSIDGISRRALNVDRAYSLLNWKSETTLEDGLQKTIDWIISEKKKN